ncbi:MAG TPA: hypothetical protein VD861_18970 [Pyrinomonadaceae bacterium]|nr:hypothetical protein [Pyrinomonadaceae bacterium]
MKRTFAYLSAALTFCVLMLTLSLPQTVQTVKAAEDFEKCNACLERIGQHFRQCQEVFGEFEAKCYEDVNRETIICYRNFCEQ